MTLLLVVLAGGLGAVARFVADGWLHSRWPARFPVATLVVNVTGSALIGLVVGASLQHGFQPGLDPHTVTVGAVGFCGGFTTFSAATLEALRLVQEERYVPAVLYLLGTLVLTVAAVAAGLFMTSVLA